jgi:exopolysaccharide production protein ExoY
MYDQASALGGDLQDPIRALPVGGGVKRLFDVVFAALGLLVLLPAFLLIALAIKLSDGGPVFYRHRRIGFNRRPFACLKFRTMVIQADEILERHLRDRPDLREEWAATQKLKQDPRVTALGIVLRRLSVDELPQMINVLRGEMSIVGPRPIVESEVALYADAIRYYFRARPGLTGQWQVSGRNDLQYATRVALDADYVRNWSFRQDVIILLKTLPAVLLSRGTY